MTTKIDFVNTSKALSQLENHLNCCMCHKFTRKPVTLGGCEHLFCSTCCEVFLGQCCPVCSIPAHVKDAEVDRPLLNLATLCYRLRRILAGKEKSQQFSKGAVIGADEHASTSGVGKQASKTDNYNSEHGSNSKTILENNLDCSSETASKQNTRRKSARRSGVENVPDPVARSKACQGDNAGKTNDETRKKTNTSGPGKSKASSRKTKAKAAKSDETSVVQVSAGDRACDRTTDISDPSSLKEEKEGNETEVADKSSWIHLHDRNDSREVSEPPVAGVKKKNVSSQKRKSQGEACPRKRTRLRHSIGGHEAESALLTMSRANTETGGQDPVTTPSASGRKRSKRKSEDQSGKLERGSAKKTPKSAKVKDSSNTELTTSRSDKKSSRRKSLPVSKTEGRQPPKDKVTGFTASKLVSDRVASPAAIDKRNAKGETALQVAAIKNDVEKVRELLAAGANPNVRDNAGWTPLHEACNHGYLVVATLLLESGAMINVPGLDNDTALHDAISNNRLDCVKLLVSRGASLTIRNMHGKTASDLAVTETMKNALHTPVTNPALSLNTQPVDVLEFQSPCLLGTGLPREGKVSLQKAANQLNVKLADEVTPEVTHIVTRCNAEGQCPRTIKLLQAVLMGKWIVNMEWLSTCTEVGSLVCEEAFEVQGTSLSPNSQAPNRGRMNRKQQLPGLFNGCQFYFHGSFEYATPSKEELISLIKAGDGQLLTREPKAGHLDDLTLTVPYHSDPASEIGHCGIYVVHENQVKFRPIRTKKMCSVPVSWIMDSASHFRLLPLPT